MKSLLLPLPLNQTTIHCCTPSPITFYLKTTLIQHRLTNHQNQVRFISLPSHFNLPRKLILSQRKQYRTNVFISACIRRNAEKETIQPYIWTPNKFLKYVDLSRKLLSGIVALYLFGVIILIGDSNGYENVFSCEDVDRYYASVDHKEGGELMRELNTITSPHVSLSYKQVWEAIKILDAADDDNPEVSSDVVEIYSLRGVSKLLAGKPEGWNREHLWPRSYGLKDGPSLTDLHNIRPADVNVNSSRGNKYYGECLANSTHCLKPANKEAAYDTETDKKIWAPPLQVRGDIARSLMYMATTYGFNQSDGSQNLRLSDSPSVENREMGLLSTLLKWNELDPPSRTEKLRNNRVCKLYQHNRNPFVDHPEYANLIWKPHTPTTITSQTNYTPRRAWINEFHYNNKGKDKNEFVEVAVRSSVDASRLKIALYNGANGRMYESLSLADRTVFNVTEGSPELLIYTVYVPLQNGRGDGVALFSQGDEDVEMLEFISCQGVVKAINGPADGITSVDIGIQETDASGENDSLGLSGEGGQFTWRKFKNEASPGRPNMGQML